MAKYFMGSEILGRYRGNYTLAISGNEIVSLMAKDGTYIEPGVRTLPIGNYTILVEPVDGYLFSSLTVNGESVPNPYEVNISFGEHLDVYSFTTVDPDNGLGGRDPDIFDNKAEPDIGNDNDVEWDLLPES